MLSSETEKAFYGYEHCSKAANLGAVQTLMVTDSLFKSDDISERKKYIALVELCRSMGAKVLIFSALHTSGEQLAQLTGIAALLNFPLPELCE
jgi:protein pelota